MPFKNEIKKLATNFPGLLDPYRLVLFNNQLIELKKQGFNKLVENILSNEDQYTLTPFLFELYICRWLILLDICKDLLYEPDDQQYPPEFRFSIGDQLFQIEAKVITQLVNEEVKKKLVRQINRQISSKTKNVIEIWLSEDIDQKEINSIVDWISDESVRLIVGEKKEYTSGDEVLAWIRAIYESSSSGGVGIEHVLGTHDEEMQKIDTDIIRQKIRSKIKKASNKFKSCSEEGIYNLVFITCDSRIFLSKETFQEALYGSEAVVSYQNENGEIKFKEILQDNGIWSKKVYTNIDIIFFIKPGVDFIGDKFDPYVFPNPHNIEKLRKIPKPFHPMKAHLPPTMLGKSIYGF